MYCARDRDAVLMGMSTFADTAEDREYIPYRLATGSQFELIMTPKRWRGASAATHRVMPPHEEWLRRLLESRRWAKFRMDILNYRRASCKSKRRREDGRPTLCHGDSYRNRVCGPSSASRSSSQAVDGLSFTRTIENLYGGRQRTVK